MKARKLNKRNSISYFQIGYSGTLYKMYGTDLKTLKYFTYNHWFEAYPTLYGLKPLTLAQVKSKFPELFT